MQLRIRHKLFFVLLAASVPVALVGLGLTRWSFNRGFVDYLNALESQRLDALALTLLEVYRAEGSWEPLTRDPRRWRAIMDESAFRASVNGRILPLTPVEFRLLLFSSQSLHSRPRFRSQSVHRDGRKSLLTLWSPRPNIHSLNRRQP